MNASRKRTLPEARFWNRIEVCARLHRSDEWFRRNRKRLERAGFPAFDELFDGWDSVAIERYLDARAGLVETSPIESDYRGVGDGL